ncbi:uncharacterized protein L203_104419 [Cryptococcus depauperatus CBS 7841]|uniref:Uncharacterized protein n=1 Tax=Cryptococcus depauperatus CBS 7841 TaxID=1295531 RepID=A0A1E3IG76_9TREE|nr:hypothetical protein L203_03357 [Cryptococcus depauperatus CBS 7841]
MYLASHDRIAMISPAESPRSSDSSLTNPPEALLTPLCELEKAVCEVSITDIAEPNEQSKEVDAQAYGELQLPKWDKTRANSKPRLGVPSSSCDFAYSAVSDPRAVSRSPSADLENNTPTDDLTSGAFSKQHLPGTPVAEQGPFEYPDFNGMSGYNLPHPRRLTQNSTATWARQPASVSFQAPLYSQLSYSSPFVTRKDFIDSDSTAVPKVGRRRPNSCSVNTQTSLASLPAVDCLPAPLSAPLPSPSVPGVAQSFCSITSVAPPHTKKPRSIMFQQKTLAAPVPPSLSRRGSLPAAQLFGLPHSDFLNRSKSINTNNGVRQQGSANTITDVTRRRQTITVDGASIPTKPTTEKMRVRATSTSRAEPYSVSYSHPSSHSFIISTPSQSVPCQATLNRSMSSASSGFTRRHPPCELTSLAYGSKPMSGTKVLRLSGISLPASPNSVTDKHQSRSSSSDEDEITTPSTAITSANHDSISSPITNLTDSGNALQWDYTPQDAKAIQKAKANPINETKAGISQPSTEIPGIGIIFTRATNRTANSADV